MDMYKVSVFLTDGGMVSATIPLPDETVPVRHLPADETLILNMPGGPAYFIPNRNILYLRVRKVEEGGEQ